MSPPTSLIQGVNAIKPHRNLSLISRIFCLPSQASDFSRTDGFGCVLILLSPPDQWGGWLIKLGSTNRKSLFRGGMNTLNKKSYFGLIFLFFPSRLLIGSWIAISKTQSRCGKKFRFNTHRNIRAKTVHLNFGGEGQSLRRESQKVGIEKISS